MSTATVVQNAQFRKELLDKLLCKKVTYQDVLRYGLSQQEIDYLHLNDILSRREYVRLIRKAGYSKKTAYKKWRKSFEEVSKDSDPKTYIAMMQSIRSCGELGVAERMEGYLKVKLEGGIPAIETLSVKDYVVDFLGLVRDELYERKTFRTDEAARKLGMSSRHIRRLAKEGKLQKENRGLISENQVSNYKIQQAFHQEQEALRKISSCIDDVIEKLLEDNVDLSGELVERFEKIKFLASPGYQKRT